MAADPAILKKIFEEFLSKYKDKRIVVVTHNRADVDALSSAFAISRILKNSIICTDEEPTEGGKLLSEKCSISFSSLSSLSAMERSKIAGLVFVDTSSYTLVPASRGWPVLCVIDHHRAEGRDVKGEFEILDTDSPSCAEIIAMIAPEIIANRDVSFALSVGIIADGARFKSARINTFETLGMLMKNCNASYPELLDYAEPDRKEEAKLSMLKTMQKMNYVYTGSYFVATSEASSNESDCASLITEAADVAFIAKWKDSEQSTRISARARKGVHVQLNKVMSIVARDLGGAGGGHPKAAGAALKCHPEQALEKCLEVFSALAQIKN